MGTINPKKWTCIIPVAGKGSRLGYDRPKTLYPINGRSMLSRLISFFRNHCSTFVIVVSPEGESDVVQELNSLSDKINYSIAVQPKPTGMADAILCAKQYCNTEQLVCVWGDQICLLESTIQKTLEFHQSNSENVLTLPTVWKKNPYIHIQRDETGRVIKVLQAREGEIDVDMGENDCGLFSFQTKALFSILEKFRTRNEVRGGKTGEQNLLQFFPEFENLGRVNTLSIATEEETLGVNTVEEAKLAESILVDRENNAFPTKLRVVMFSGGRGTSTLAPLLTNHPQIQLTMLINGYDDGLSTGRLREFIPGFLGPSDFRKNLARLIPSDNPSNRALKFIIEYRLPDSLEYADAITLLDNLLENESSLLSEEFWEHLNSLTIFHAKYFQRKIKRFLEYCKDQEKKDIYFSFQDCSLGNILFAGIFLEMDRDFNKSLASFVEAVKPKAKILNLTQGEPLVLVGLKSDGSVMKKEADIVAPQNKFKMKDIFLLEKYLSNDELKDLEKLDLEEKHQTLLKREVLPQISEDTRNEIENADLIIYGPGTQHSSLFPSYLTVGLYEAIKKNVHAEKIFISNIVRDHEIQDETTNTLVDKFIYYMNRKRTSKITSDGMVNQFFFQQTGENPKGKSNSPDYLDLDIGNFKVGNDKQVIMDWEDEGGTHHGSRVVDELISIVNEKVKHKIKNVHYMVSIIVPVLNEEHTLEKVLSDLNLINFQPHGLSKEIIVVDGGSNDNSVEIAKSKNYVRFYQLPNDVHGRGAAFRLGVEKAKGDIVALFPSDDEYEAKDLLGLVDTKNQGEFEVIFGSRSIRCRDITGRINQIYAGKIVPSLISKFGGMFFSILYLILFNRFITDPFTGVKIFNRRLFNSLGLKANGVELEAEILARLAKERAFILELPIDYRPRLKSEGKKITVLEGLYTLLYLIKMKFSQ